jgi:hypothetical protein
MRFVVAICGLASALLGACGDGAAAADDGGAITSATFQSCLAGHASVGVMTYAPGMSVSSADGKYVVTLTASHPGVPADASPGATPVRGNNTWDLTITDASNVPSEGLQVAASVSMPDHSHPTTVQPQVSAGDAPGAYVLSPLYFFMAGYWKVTLSLTPGSADGDAGAPAPSESAAFKLCIQ